MSLEKKYLLRSYIEIYRHLLLKSLKNAALGQKMVQCKCFFWHQTETCLLEKILTENLILKKTLISTGTFERILKICMREIIFSKNDCFQKKTSKHDILNNIYFGPNFVIFGTALRCFSQCFFLIFCRWLTIMANIFTQYWWILSISSYLSELWSTEKSYTVPFKEVSFHIL